MVGEIILTNISVYYCSQQRRRETTGRSLTEQEMGGDKLQIMQFVPTKTRQDAIFAKIQKILLFRTHALRNSKNPSFNAKKMKVYAKIST